VPGDERALDALVTARGPAIPRALRDEPLELLGLMPGASNYTFLARAGAEPDGVLAIYKPRRGEIPLWDFPDGTLHLREVAAYVIASFLGWPNVPPTVLRDGPEGPGSAQLFVEFDPAEHYFTLEMDREDEFRDVCLFDLVANNADRKAGHCLLGTDGAVRAIDHGVCFSDEPKLRTVIWNFVGEPIPPERLSDLERLRDAAGPGGAIAEVLAELLAPAETDAMLDRIQALGTSGVFPAPGPGRPYPWPPI
jgi:hypothetical protein